VAHATERAPLFVPEGRATFRVGDLAGTGLQARCADAVVCIDSIQFAPDKDAAAREAYRILRPGGRYVQTNWQPSDPEDPAVPERMRALRFGELLSGAGFTAITVEERPDLAELVTQVFRAALEIDPGDDVAMQRLRDEASLVLGWPDVLRRVLVIAERPADV
jgi:ubiquinone/menaquinone biosynthesis C-methylase UbiE